VILLSEEKPSISIPDRYKGMLDTKQRLIEETRALCNEFQVNNIKFLIYILETTKEQGYKCSHMYTESIINDDASVGVVIEIPKDNAKYKIIKGLMDNYERFSLGMNYPLQIDVKESRDIRLCDNLYLINYISKHETQFKVCDLPKLSVRVCSDEGYDRRGDNLNYKIHVYHQVDKFNRTTPMAAHEEFTKLFEGFGIELKDWVVSMEAYRRLTELSDYFKNKEVVEINGRISI